MKKLTAVENKTEPKLYSAVEAWGDFAKAEEFMEIRPILVGFLMSAPSEKQAVDGLMKLAAVFTRFEEMVDVEDFVNDIQRYLFTWTQEHTKSLDKYLKSIGIKEQEPVELKVAA